MIVHIDSNLNSYLVKFGFGFNEDDVIITQFINYNVKSSKYYLYSTLSEQSNFEQILSLR